MFCRVIASFLLFYFSFFDTYSQQVPRIRRTNSVFCPPNIDFEEGSFNHWVLDTGFVRGVDGIDPTTNQNFFSIHGPSPTGLNMVTVTSTPAMPNRHEIITNLGIPAPLDFFGGFSINPPDGSGFAIKLGSDRNFPGTNRPNARAERATYVIQVPSGVTDYSITYQYAVVFQDPGHVSQNQPRFTVNLYDPLNGNSVPCGFVEYVADSTIPGFLRSPRDRDVWYKSWTPVFINLSNYAGRTLHLEFTTEDCAQGGHWGYAYLDVNGCRLSVSAVNSCDTPGRTVLDGPPGFLNYNWWNNDFTVLLATGQHATLIPGLSLNTQLHLEVVPNTGIACRDTLTTNVTQDTVRITPDTDKYICEDSALNIGVNQTEQHLSYQWSGVGISQNTNQSVVAVQPLSSTFYYLTATDTSTGCKSYDTIFVKVNPKPVIIVSGANICRGSSATIVASGANQFNWSPSLGLNVSTGAYVIASPTATTLYHLSGLIDSSGCRADTTVLVQVNATPNASLIFPSQACIGNDSLLFRSTSNINNGTISNYFWYVDNVMTSSSSSFFHRFSNTGSHSVKLIVSSDNGCIDSVSRNINIIDTPIVNITALTNNACVGDSIRLIALAQPPVATSYLWYYGNSVIPTANTNELFVRQSGTYHVSITDNNACSGRASIPVIFHPKPQANLQIPSITYICEGGGLPLQVNGNGYTYQWYLNGQSIPGAVYDSFFASLAGNYTVQAVSSQGCEQWAAGNINLSIYKKPVARFIFNGACLNKAISFINQSDTSGTGPVRWKWDFGDGTQSNASNPTHVFTSTNQFPVSLSVESTFCPSLNAVSSLLIPVSAPRPGLRYRIIEALPNTNIPLMARDFGTHYLWWPPFGLSNNNTINPIFRYGNSMEYQIRITDLAGCVTVDTQFVRMQRAVDIQVPTAFSPNGDGHNDQLNVFLVGIVELRFFRVFNRWGQLLFETKNPNQLWDGLFHGKKQPAETYVWTAEGIDVDGEKIIRRGQTILIR